MAEHQDHDTVSAAAEITESPTELEESGQNIPQIPDGEPDVALLQEGLGAIDLAGEAEEDNEMINEPTTRADFLQYSRELLTLDPNTANRNLMLSDENRKATRIVFINSEKKNPKHPDRFTGCCQVLSRENLTGRCYWEVEWSGEGVEVAVVGSDPDLEKRENRKGKHKVSGFGQNDTSWALRCNSYNYRHNGLETPVSGPQFSRVGVYLDHSAGILRFYSVEEDSDTMILLKTVDIPVVTPPLYAGLHLFGAVGDTAELCDLQ